MVRHLFLNELLSFLWMHVYKVQLWRHGSPERVNIPSVGLWWGYTKTKTEFKRLHSDSHFLIPQRADKHKLCILMVYILTISPPGQILQNPEVNPSSGKLPNSPRQIHFPNPKCPVRSKRARGNLLKHILEEEENHCKALSVVLRLPFAH